MKILLIGCYANERMQKELNQLSRSDGTLSVAAIKYTHMIGEGFRSVVGKNVTNLFLVPIGMYPICKLLKWKIIEINGDHYIPFINVLLLKQLSIMLYVFYFSFKWYFQNKGVEKKIIVFSFLYLPFLLAVVPLKMLSNVSIISFVPDMPEYEFSYSKEKNLLKQILIPLYIKLSENLVKVNDFFVYVTKYMKDYYGNKPYQVVEGFVDKNLQSFKSGVVFEKKAIMYAGALYEKFGIRLLLNAFLEISGDYELWLFGTGDMVEEIISFSQKDPRIIFFGSRPNNEIIEYEKKAKLLVNPRLTNNEFTKFSFPSKLLEYMASGTPVLTTRLLGIPNEYNDKMFYIELETKEGLKDSLLNCLLKTQRELDVFGENARSFVLKEKNNHIQIKNLMIFIENQLTYK